MNPRKATLGACVAACLLAGCGATSDNAKPLPGAVTEPPESEMAKDETPDTKTMQMPESAAERRELRRQLAERDKRKLERLTKVPADTAEPVRGEVPDELIERIVDDLAGKIGAEPAAIEVLHTESLIWPDGALGCGKPGQEYTHAPVPGYRVILEHAGQQFDYRANTKGYFMLCDSPVLASPGAGVNPPVQ